MTYAVVFITQGTRRIPIQHTKARYRNASDSGRCVVPADQGEYGGGHPDNLCHLAGAAPHDDYTGNTGKHSLRMWLKEKSMYLNPGNIPNITIPLKPHPIAFPFPIALFLYFLLVIVFTYFYTAIVMNVQEMADNLKKYGNYIPGIRPGKPTLDYLERVVSRITLAGAVFLGLIAVSQYILPNLTGFSQAHSRSSEARLS